MNKKLQTILTFLSIVAAISCGLKFFATKDDMAEAMDYIEDVRKQSIGYAEKVNDRLSQNINKDAIIYYDQQMSKLKDKYPGLDVTQWPDESDRERYRKLKLDMEDTIRKQEALINKNKGDLE